MGAGLLPSDVFGVAANAAFIAAGFTSRLLLFNNSTGAFVHRIDNLKGWPSVRFCPDGSHRMVISEDDGGRVSVYGLDGECIRSFGKGQLGRPMDVEFETSGDILIVDRRNNKIGVFSEEGVLLREFVGPPLFDSPTALAMRNGRLYVLNSRNVQILE